MLFSVYSQVGTPKVGAWQYVGTCWVDAETQDAGWNKAVDKICDAVGIERRSRYWAVSMHDREHGWLPDGTRAGDGI